MKRKQPLPEWLETWLNLPFYKEECTKHDKKYQTVYCGSCNDGRPACEVCWETISDQHDKETHQILKVRIASRRVATDVTEISQFLDVSKIQIYKINNRKIVFLNPNTEATSDAHSKPNCRTCERRLKQDDVSFGFEFCSISCKLYCRSEEVDNLEKDEEKSNFINLMMSDEKLETMNEDECCKVETSLRKKSRKGKPCIAPRK